MTFPRRRILAAALLTPLLLVGCSGTKDNRPPELIANDGLAPWQGDMRMLYDDQIDPAALGLSMSGRSPSQDPLLKLRAQAADITARMRVQTITRETAGNSSSYLLNLQVGIPTFLPARINDRTVELSVPPSSTSFGIVQSMENSLRGRIFIGFVKRFAGPEGPEFHYHLTSDNAEVAKAINEVALLEELTK